MGRSGTVPAPQHHALARTNACSKTACARRKCGCVPPRLCRQWHLLGPVHESCGLPIKNAWNLGPVKALSHGARKKKLTRQTPRLLMGKVQESCTRLGISRFFGTLSGSCLNKRRRHGMVTDTALPARPPAQACVRLQALLRTCTDHRHPAPATGYGPCSMSGPRAASAAAA